MPKNLFRVSYSDSKKSIGLTNYADTIIYEKRGNRKMLCAIRFGGYPEQVEAMVNAIYGGGCIFAETKEYTVPLYGLEKQYTRQMTHDSVYAEATLITADGCEQADEKDKKGSDKEIARKILSAYLSLLTAYPDQPYDQPPIVNPISGAPIVTPPDMADINTLMPKDEKALEIVRAKIANGERALIYTNWTRLDTQKKLLKFLQNEGYHTEIMMEKIKPRKREKWVADRVAEGLQVLITNPSLVETGLDLNAFTTIIYYDTGFKLFTLRQASKRSYRVNQTAPRIEVYMLYYVDTLQHKAMKLMASKLAVAAIIEGGFSEEGLAAMSQCEDMTTIMAKELMLGIKDSVEDVSAAFKKMAILKSANAPSNLVEFSLAKAEAPAGDVQYAAVEFSVILPAVEKKMIPVPLPVKDKGGKTVEAIALGQMSLFDLSA